MRHSLAALVFLLSALGSLAGPQQHRARTDEPPTAKVKVIAFEANGRFLGVPNVTVFESATGQNMSATFRGGVADGLPYGIYRIEAKLPGYYSDVTYASVYQPNVSIVMGLRFAAELPRVPPMLSGTVKGLPAQGKSFAKIVGVFEHISAESVIDQGGGFSLAGLASGRYMLLIVGEKGVLANRAVTIPYLGPPLELKLDGETAPR